MGQLVFQATLGGQVNLVGPNTASTYNINVPAVAGNMVTTGDTGTVTNTMLAGSIANAKLSNSAVTIGSTSVSLGATSTTLDGVNIGATTAGTGGFTSLAYSTTLTGGTGIVNLGSGQFYKDASGNVGIGTSSPSSKLDVAGTTRVSNTTGNKILYVGQSTPSGNDGASLEFQNSSTQKNWAIRSNYNIGGALEFCPSSASGGTSYASPAVAIDSSGNLLVGATGNPSSTVAGSRLGNITTNACSFSAGSNTGAVSLLVFFNGNGTVGQIYSSGSSTVYATSSDYRLKENIAPMTGALATVAQLKPCTYNWKADGADGQGFIAHELQSVVPDCVTGAKDAVDENGNPVYQGIDTSFLVATLTAAIQELKGIIDTQATTITQLQADVTALKV